MAEKRTMKVSQIKANPTNPRIIKDDKFKKLVESLRGFPEMMEKRPMVCVTDVDGKLFPLGGNMRLRAIQELGMKEIPDTWVTLADDWTEEKRKEFTIKDNASFGEWNWEDLANEWDADLLSDWGLDVPNLEEIDKLEDGEEIELPQSVQLEPPMEYILVMAEPNSVEWEELKETLQLRMVRRGGYKKGSAFDAVALERVLNWNDLKERLNANSSTK
jgi:ParB-like chromosome segregation protein Spo0J